MKSEISKTLIEAYLKTSYKVFKPEMTIAIGKDSAELNDLLRKKGCNEWAYITSVNPYSESQTDEQNQQLYESLKDTLKVYKFYEGHGVGINPEWPPEISLLVIGIQREEAIHIEKQYKQNAIVVGVIDCPAELVLLR